MAAETSTTTSRPSKKSAETSQHDAVVSFRHVAKSFGTKRVHTDITFELRRGELLGLIGGFGAGKVVIFCSPLGLLKTHRGGNFFLGPGNLKARSRRNFRRRPRDFKTQRAGSHRDPKKSRLRFPKRRAL